ncbi:sorbitol dehydrogenase [Phyllosticta citriasiana]|uniref:sorbitol dehydrogenase n=1 Tax=Phyllosticta citriasiana TaxID=595635 RepID=UPI0030FD7DDE
MAPLELASGINGSSKPSLMKAVRFHGKGDLRLEDIPEPHVGPSQIKLKPAWVGICGTDLHEYLGGPNLCPTTPHPITREKVPVTFGHELSGVIEEVGDGVDDLRPGDRVCVQPIIYDGTCGACEAGLVNCCYNNGFIGLSGWGGGFSEHMVIPRDAVYKLPDNVSLEVGALIEPLAVGWHAVKIAALPPPPTAITALILGGGPIGLSMIQSLRAHSPNHTIIVSEPSPKRAELAASFGATHVLSPLTSNIPATVRKLSPGGWGAHVAFDCAGVQAGLDDAVESVRAEGKIVNVAIWEKPPRVDANALCFKERTYMGVATYRKGDFAAVIDAVSQGLITPEAMISKRVDGLDGVLEGGFKSLIADRDRLVKVLIRANDVGE